MRFLNLICKLGLFTFALSTHVDYLKHAPPDYGKLVEYAQYASIAYCLKKGLSTGKLGENGTNCPLEVCTSNEFKDTRIVRTFNCNEWSEGGSGYCAIDKKQKRILLVFRGTASRRDWTSNIDFFPVKYTPLSYTGELLKTAEPKIECENCSAHRGFYGLLKKPCIRSVLEEVIEMKEKHPDYNLVIVGHSLGAALTLLSGIEFQLLGYEPLVLSYASPRVGNSGLTAFADKVFNTKNLIQEIDSTSNFDKGYIRVVHKNDLIPCLPPSPIFEQCGYEYFITKRDLPHGPSTVERRGSGYFDDQLVSDLTITNRNMWHSFLRKYEHTNYLVKISGC